MLNLIMIHFILFLASVILNEIIKHQITICEKAKEAKAEFQEFVKYNAYKYFPEKAKEVEESRLIEGTFGFVLFYLIIPGITFCILLGFQIYIIYKKRK